MSVLERVLARLDDQPGAAVVFDLDSTLFDNGPRTVRIMLEWAHSHQPQLVGSIERLSRHRVAYSLGENAARIEGWDDQWLESLKGFWFSRFFADAYINFDEPVDGAPAFVRSVRARGGHVVYLTGRDVPGMWTGTCDSLRAYGFPVGVPGVQLVLKPDFETDDSVFKGDVIPQIDAYCGAGVVATFENEAKNLLVMREAWPDAEHILLDTNWDPRNPASLRDGFTKIPDFRMA
jgi:hypothetical protein